MLRARWLGQLSSSCRRIKLPNQLGTFRILCTNGSGSKNTTIYAGIFLDAENLTQFLKDEGGRKLVDSAIEFGNPIVRRAYGNWSLPSLNIHQHQLIENGFQLIHTPHPVPKKNAADIAMVVDVMDILHRMRDLQCFVLATGDSDFSQLFCHLRQAGRTVVGVGPRSVLSEVVKNSTDRFIYTDPPPAPAGAGAGSEPRTRDQLRTAQFALAVALLDRALAKLPADAPLNMGRIKESMLLLDSAFDQREAGFASFSGFLEASGRIHFHPPEPSGHRYVSRRADAAVTLR